MTDELERRGHRAGAAVHARAGQLPAEGDLQQVLRRGSRPRTGPVVALLLVAALAVPGVAWFLRGGDQQVRFADDPPATVTPTGEPATPQPTDPPDPGPAPTGPPTTPPGTPPAGPTVEPRDGPEALGEFGTGEVVTDGFPFEGTGVALLTDVRLAGQDGFDRIVLEFRGEEPPGYRVAYTEPPILQDGSGEAVAVEGEAFLHVHLTPASGVDMSDMAEGGFEITYEGSDRLTGATGVITEFVRLGDFEANLTWVAGLRTQAPFAVTVLQDPLRLVIDVQTP